MALSILGTDPLTGEIKSAATAQGLQIPAAQTPDAPSFKSVGIPGQSQASEMERQFEADWRNEFHRRTQSGLLDFENFLPDKREAVKKRSLIQGVLSYRFNADPSKLSGGSYRMARAHASNALFGKPMGDDEFFTALQGQAKEEQGAMERRAKLRRGAETSMMTDEFFGTWRERNSSGVEGEKESARELLEWERDRQALEEKHGEILPEARQLFGMIREDSLSYGKIFSLLDTLEPDEMADAAKLVRVAIDSLPEAEQKNVWQNLTTQAARDTWGLAGKAWRGAVPLVADALIGSPEFSDARSAKKGAEKDRDIAEGFLAEMLRLRDEVDPVIPLSKEGTALGYAERALYATPGVGVSIGVAATPVIGAPATIGMMERASFEQVYLRNLDSGMSREESSELASMVSGPIAAISYIPERIGAKGVLTGRWGALDKVINFLPDKLTNKVARRAVGGVAGGLAETSTEALQSAIQEAGQDVVQALNKDAPGGDWQSFRDNFASENLTTFLSILPYTMIGVTIRDRGLTKQFEALEGASDAELQAAGYLPDYIKKFRDADGPASKEQAVVEMANMMEVGGEIAKSAAKEIESGAANRISLQEQAQAAGILPKIVARSGEKTVDVLDFSTGEMIAEGATPAEAAQIAGAQFRGRDREREQFIDSIVAQIEGSQELLEGREGEAEITPAKKLTESEAAEMFRGSDQRLADEAALMEQIEGGNGEVSRTVLGASLPRGYQGRAAQVNAMFGGSNLFTAIHEHTHETRRQLIAKGAFAREDQISQFQEFDELISKQVLTEFKDGQKVEVSGESLRFLPSNFAEMGLMKQETALDEAFSQLAEVLILRTRNGKKTRFRELLNKNLSAQVRAGKGSAIKLKAFVRAMREWFGLNLQRSQIIKRAERSGELDSAKLDALSASIFNTTPQQEFENEVEAEYREIVTAADIARGAQSQSTPFDDVINRNRRRGEQAFPEEVPTELDEDGNEVDVPFSIGREQDAAYLSAVESGDVAKQQEMVGEAIKSALPKNMKVLYRGLERVLSKDYEKNKRDSPSGYSTWTDSLDLARQYAGENGFVYTIFVPKNEVKKEYIDKDGERSFAYFNDKKAGLSGVKGNEFLLYEDHDLFSFENIKSADPVTYDEAGNVIPLSKRFDETRDEISYSLGTSQIADALIGDLYSRVKSPEVRAKLMGDSLRRLKAMTLDFEEGAKITNSQQAQEARLAGIERLQEELSNLGESAVTEREAQLLDLLDAETMEREVLQQALAEDFSSLENGTEERVGDVAEKIVGDFAHRIEDAGLSAKKKTALKREASIRLQERKKAQKQLDGKEREVLRQKIKLEKSEADRRVEKVKADLEKERVSQKGKTAARKEQLKRRIAEKEALSKRFDVRGSLATLDAMLMALPSELRGKVGGFVQLAKLNSDEKRLEFLLARIEKMDQVIERWAKKEFNKSAKALFKRASARRQEAGKSDRGKYDARLHELFQTVESAMQMESEAVDGLVAGIIAQRESLEQSGTLTPEQEVQFEQMENLSLLFGDWKNASASDREAALISGWRAFNDGFARSVEERLARQEEWERQRAALVAQTGKLGTAQERDQKVKSEHKLGNWFTALGHGMMDFSQALGWTFGENSKEAERFSEWEREADYQKKDNLFAHQDAMEAFFRDTLADGDAVKGLKLQHAMQTETFETKVVPRELTLGQMIQARMMWRQEDGQRHMKGRDAELDKDGNVIREATDWKYTQEFMNEIDALMTPEARALESFLSERYLEEWESLNAVHERIFGITMPRNGMYSPLTMSPIQTKLGSIVDPLTGQNVSTMSATPTSLIRRSSSAVAEPNFSDAIYTYFAHKTQVEHWMAYAELTKEMQAVLGNRKVRNAVLAKTGTEGLNTLSKWTEVFAMGGVKESATATGLMKSLQRGVNRASQAALVGRVSVLAIQSTQIGAAYAQMPSGAYVKRLSKLLSGQLDYKEAWSSDFIQRRMKDAPPAVRMAMEQMRSADPSRAKYLAHKMGQLISGADAFFTAGTYAMIYDYQVTALGMDKEAAHKAAQKLTEEVAQPVRMGARSLVENTTQSNPLTRLAWAFSSEPRQKIMLAAYRSFTGRTTAEKARAYAVTWGFGGAFAAVLRAISADIRDDDDDEVLDSKHWNPSRLVAQTLAGPFQGVPVFGEGIEAVIFAGFREVGLNPGYLPSGNILETPQRGAQAALNLATFDSFESAEKLIRDIDAIITGSAPFNDSAAAYASFSHLARDTFSAGKNALKAISN